MKFIGERISYVDKNEVFTVVITPLKNKGKEALLFAWVMAWTLCGVYFVYYLSIVEEEQTKRAVFIMLAFWAYFEFLGVKALLWRKYGKEMIRITSDQLSIKNAFKSYGKARQFHTENISNVEVVDVNESGYKHQYGQAYYSTKGERIAIKYVEKYIGIGKQLELSEAKELAKVLNQKIKHLNSSN